jgi:DUF4097 and DUF4098 domain-containing protein YvlB
MNTKYWLLITALIFILSPCYGHSTKDSKESLKGYAYKTQSYTVSKGGTLEVSLAIGDIIISSWQKDEVNVKAEGIEQEDINNVHIEQLGNSVRVSFHPEYGYTGQVRFTISVPTEFNTQLSTAGGDIELLGGFKGSLNGSTSGGDIKLTDVDGQVTVKTSGGDIEAGKINGTCILHTSGGDIHVQSSGGEVELSTSGGDVTIGNVGKSLTVKTSGGDVSVGDVGGELSAITAGGDIEVGKVSGNATLKTAGGNIQLRGATGSIRAKTAGGDVTLQNISGSVDASTAGGNVEADLHPSGTGNSRLSSSGGDVTLYIPENAKATIDAIINVRGRWNHAEQMYTLSSDFKAKTFEKDADSKEIHGTYVLNGGGEQISLETTNGNIYIRRK